MLRSVAVHPVSSRCCIGKVNGGNSGRVGITPDIQLRAYIINESFMLYRHSHTSQREA